MLGLNFILILGILLVVFYDFTNGFHDAADMVAQLLLLELCRLESLFLLSFYLRFYDHY